MGRLKLKICPQCGAEFTCGVATGSCWCHNFKVLPENLKLLKEKYRDCLCPACLAPFCEKIAPDTCRK